MRRVFSGKADGAWFLHKHTMGDEVVAFLQYSSLSSIFGNRSSGNYAGANSYLDALARSRCSKGLPCTSILWPYIAHVGMVASSPGAPSNQLLSLSPESVSNVLTQVLLLPNDSTATKIVLNQNYLRMASTLDSVSILFSSAQVLYIHNIILHGWKI